MKNYLALIAFVLTLPLSTLADETYKKKIQKVYPAAEINLLSLSNRFGDVDFITGETDKLQIDVTISVEADDEAEAESFFRDISIEINRNGSEVSARTTIGERREKGKFRIDYKVKLPKRITIDVSNRFGNIYANDLYGYHNIELDYGSLKIGKLINKKNMQRAKVYMGYSNGNIETCEWLNVEIKYSNLNIQKSQALILNSKYSKVKIERSSSIVAVSKYDSPYKIGTVNNMKATGAYSNFRVDKLNNRLILDVKYTDVKVGEVSTSFKEGDITLKYGTVVLPIPKEVSYEVFASAKYGKIQIPEGNNLNRHKESNYIEYSGHVGSTDTSKKVKASARYGTLVLMP